MFRQNHIDSKNLASASITNSSPRPKTCIKHGVEQTFMSAVKSLITPGFSP
jgi:hypothetical protein